MVTHPNTRTWLATWTFHLPYRLVWVGRSKKRFKEVPRNGYRFPVDPSIPGEFIRRGFMENA